MSGTADAHRAAAAREDPIPVAVVTVSDSRTPETDGSGRYLRQAIADAGHRVADYRIVPDDPERIAAVLAELTGSAARVVVFNGGTGVSRRDTTFDVVAGRLDKPLPGFGELFRMLSWHEVGAAAMLSRATAGVVGDCVVVSLPGSPNAVRLAWEKLLAPELAHLAWEVTR